MIFADNSIVSEAGRAIRPVYSPKVLEDGSFELVESGKEDFNEYIQSFRESCDISIILNRIAQGDLSALEQGVGTYGDFTKMPKSYAEFLQMQIDTKNMFNSFPPEIKSRFGNDPNVFLSTAGTVDWFDKVGELLNDEVRDLIFKARSVPVESEKGEGE